VIRLEDVSAAGDFFFLVYFTETTKKCSRWKFQFRTPRHYPTLAAESPPFHVRRRVARGSEAELRPWCGRAGEGARGIRGWSAEGSAQLAMPRPRPPPTTREQRADDAGGGLAGGQGRARWPVFGDSTVSFLVKGNFLDTSVPCAHAISDFVYASLSGMLQMHRSR
jgi:hypothetical protein